MIAAYFNYPNSHVTIHASESCPMIQMQQKPDQRVLFITTKSLSGDLERFEIGEFRFSATSKTNDLWLSVDLGNADTERAVVARVKRILGRRYRPFETAPTHEHC